MRSINFAVKSATASRRPREISSPAFGARDSYSRYFCQRFAILMRKHFHISDFSRKSKAGSMMGLGRSVSWLGTGLGLPPAACVACGHSSSSVHPTGSQKINSFAFCSSANYKISLFPLGNSQFLPNSTLSLHCLDRRFCFHVNLNL